MPFGLVRVCKVTAEECRAVTELLEVDNRARWSAGLVSYTGEETSSGSVVTEVWATREAKSDSSPSAAGPRGPQRGGPPASMRRWPW
jgi:hypothetical protein